MKEIILTGFEKYGPHPYNPTEELVKEFNGKVIKNYKVTGIVLPCTYSAFDTLEVAINEIHPNGIVSTGLSSRIGAIRLETTGRNSMEAPYPDANGFDPKGVLLLEGGEEFLRTYTDNEYLAYLLDHQDIPVDISTNAGTFICNALLYSTSNHIQKNNLRMSNAYMHTPWTDNFSSLVKLEHDQHMIPREYLYDATEILIQNVTKR